MVDNPNYVIYMPTSVTELRTEKNVYEKGSTKDNKYVKWAMDKMFAFLMKRGYLATKRRRITEIGTEAVTLDLDKLDEQIAMNRNAIESVYNRRVGTLICGRDVMSQIVRNNISYSQPSSVRLNGPSNYAEFSQGGASQTVMYNNLEVILVPWFKGFLVLPDRE